MTHYTYIVKPVMRALKKCPHKTGVPSPQVHLKVKVQIDSQKIQYKHPNKCPLIISGFTVPSLYYIYPITKCLVSVQNTIRCIGNLYKYVIEHFQIVGFI